MVALASAGAGFLLAVLWFDLMFDVQVRGHRGPELPPEVLASVAAYYRRVTTAAQPMTKLIAVVMFVTVAAIIKQIVDGGGAAWAGWASLGFAAVPILLAGTHTVPNAVRLGSRSDTAERQSELARSTFREHVVCLVSISALLAVQLSQA